MLKHSDIRTVKSGVYRGPEPKSIKDLLFLYNNYGIRSIISLEEGWSELFGLYEEDEDWLLIGRDKEKEVMFHHIAMSNIFPPTKSEVQVVAEKIRSMKVYHPNVYIHCYAGVDRTGFCVAYYRVKHCNYSPEEAWAEAQNMGMHKRYFWWKKSFMNYTKDL